MVVFENIIFNLFEIYFIRFRIFRSKVPLIPSKLINLRHLLYFGSIDLMSSFGTHFDSHWSFDFEIIWTVMSHIVCLAPCVRSPFASICLIWTVIYCIFLHGSSWDSDKWTKSNRRRWLSRWAQPQHIRRTPHAVHQNRWSKPRKSAELWKSLLERSVFNRSCAGPILD